jgi:hypothetical protein
MHSYQGTPRSGQPFAMASDPFGVMASNFLPVSIGEYIFCGNLEG